MPDESDPPRKFYELKPTEFEVINPPIGKPGNEAPIDIRDLYRQAGAVQGSPAIGESAKKEGRKAENDVHAILRANLAHEDAAGVNKLAEKKRRPSKRKRDYFLVMVGGNGLLGFLAVSALATHNAILFVYAVAGIGLLSASVTWLLWVVLDDY